MGERVVGSVRVATNGVGAAVRDRRRVLGISQTELGRRAGGLTQDYISKLENGVIETPQRGTMDALALALDVPVAHLYRAAGILDGVDEAPLALPALPTSPARDADRVPIAQKVADVEARRGEHYQRRLQAARERMSRADYEAFCAALWGMWEGNSLMVFQLLDRDGGTE
jgi:transcriptional regulator with XRE-family HTH domain